jgi:choline dehydrogenase-like flavoprotein
VYLHANLCEIILSPSQDAIRAVRCKTEGRPDSIFTAEHFVFCLGGLETARVLMQPIHGLQLLPWNTSDTLGRYFQDHLDVSAATLSPLQPRDFHLQFDNLYLGGFRYIPKVKADSWLQERLKILAVGASFVPQSTRQDVVEQFRNTLHRYQRGEQRTLGREQLLQAAKATDILLRKSWRYVRHHRAYNPDDLGVDLRIHCEQAPNANSRVALSRDRDASGLFRIQLDWQFGQLEVTTIRKFVEHAARVFEQSGVASVQIHRERLESVQSLASHITDSYHHMGTTRMANSPRNGVVDPNCQLFGTANGFVCSSGVFPSSGFSNPTHTILALAVRLAEFISGRTKR